MNHPTFVPMSNSKLSSKESYQPPELTSQQWSEGIKRLSELPKSDLIDIINAIKVLPKSSRAKAVIVMALRWKIS